MPLPLRLAVVGALLAASCGRATSTQAPVAQGDVVARVNGVAIDRAELSAASREGSPHGGAPEPAGAALENAVFEELLAQRAVARGLDRDPVFLAEVRRAEARLRAWRRTQLAALAERQAGAEPVTVDEARRYYDAHEAQVRGEVMVAQMLIRDETAAEAALRELRGGASFDDVARRLHPERTDPAARPWEMGFLRWQQLPDAWRAPLDALQPGQTSAVIRGPNRRFWILKLLARRQAEGVTFASVRPLIVQRLTEERRLGARDRLRAELLRGARVEYPRGAQ
ncbi:MAG: peptidyl-prolyl cis-trans isomerase [Polyangiales bacterium]